MQAAETNNMYNNDIIPQKLTNSQIQSISMYCSIFFLILQEVFFTYLAEDETLLTAGYLKNYGWMFGASYHSCIFLESEAI